MVSEEHLPVSSFPKMEVVLPSEDFKPVIEVIFESSVTLI
jgi:hypothetical protein